MRPGGVFAVQSLDGVRLAGVRRGDRYRGSEVSVPGETTAMRSWANLQDGCRLFASDAIGVGKNIGTAVNAKPLTMVRLGLKGR